jgi:hypothetical protein
MSSQLITLVIILMSFAQMLCGTPLTPAKKLADTSQAEKKCDRG